jgi:phage terminase large subunit-like protein
LGRNRLTEQFTLDGFLGRSRPPTGRPRKWLNESERRAHENEKRRKRRAAAREQATDPRSASAAAPASSAQLNLAHELTRALARSQEGGAQDALEVRDADLLEIAHGVPGLLRPCPNVAEGLQYARDVIAQRIPACVYVRQACERHERDLLASEDAAWPYRFDAARAERALRAFQNFREVKGPRAGRRLRLAPWQRFICASLFGWLEKASGFRRFTYAFIAVPRGNGKSTMAAPIALYMLALDGEGGAEVYTAAVTRDQARIVFAMARYMAQRDREFRERYGVQVEKHQITQESSASTFTPLSRDADALDGKNVHLAILDELAKHKTREVHDVLVTAAGKRSQPLIAGITTAASNQAGIGYEQWKYTLSLLACEVADDHFFGIVYTIDTDDDWRDVNVWRKANPNWGLSVMPKAIRALAERAQNVPALQNSFKQKHLNIWTHSSVAWIDQLRWQACADETLRELDHLGDECIIGLDLAAKIDLCARVNLYTRDIEGITHYFAFARFYLPEATIEESANASYAGWARAGFLTSCPGETIDQEMIEREILKEATHIVIRDLAYDPWNCLNLASRLDRAGVPCIEYRPSLANFSLPMKELEALVREKRFHHDGHPVLSWCMSCVEAFANSNGDMRPTKDTNNPLVKIDGAIALLMALGRRLTLDAGPRPSVG